MVNINCLKRSGKFPGPLKFEEISTTNPMTAKVKFVDWKHCRDICLQKKYPTTNYYITYRIDTFITEDKGKSENKTDNLKTRIEDICKTTQYSKIQHF